MPQIITVEISRTFVLISFFLSPLKQLQHSLVSEIRDLIYPEDRLRFDELMFRHGITVNVGSS
jgi:hypothetical protein